MNTAFRAFAAAALLGLGACGHGENVPPFGSMQNRPQAVSPDSIPAPPMAKTRVLPSSAMRSPASTHADITGLNWSQIPGTAVVLAAAADGSLWALSNQPSGPDKYIWHYVSGVWTNIPGLATQLSAAPDGTLYAINSGGGTYAYKSGIWTALGGGASALAAAGDGSVYVISNAGPGPDRAIWHNAGGVWTQFNGSGSILAGSADSSTYTLPAGTVAPDGVYILNSSGGIYYENTDKTFAHFPGAGSGVAASIGGLFVLAYPANTAGSTLYYYDYTAPGWSTPGGAGISVTASTTALYVAGGSGAIYEAPLSNPSGTVVLTPSSLTFDAAGSAYAQTVTASEQGYNGAFSAGACTSGGAAIASVAPVAGSGTAFTVTPQYGGSCTLAISDSLGNSARLPVSVTASTVTTVIPPGWAVTPNVVTLDGSGSQVVIAAAENGYAGTFTAAIADTSIASVSPASSGGRFTLTGSANGGTTTLTIADAKGAQAVITVQNTATSVIVQHRSFQAKGHKR